jgi:WD40 repeat protein
MHRTLPFFFFAAAIVIAAPADAAPFVPNRNAESVAISPDGSLVATGKSGMSNSEFPPRPHPSPNKCGLIEIWEAGTGKRLHRMETFGDLIRVEFSPDGRLLASTRLYRTSDGVELDQVRVLNVATGEISRDLNRCHAFAFSPDAREMAVVTRGKCMVYDLQSWKKVREIEPLADAVGIEFSPRGDSIAAVKQDGDKFRISLCDARTGGEIAVSPGLSSPFYALTFSPDGGHIATGHKSGILIWDVAGAKADGLQAVGQFKTSSGEFEHPFFSPDGQILAAGNQENGDVLMWERQTGKELRRFSFDRGKFHTQMRRGNEEVVRPEQDPDRFTFTPDGAAFLCGADGGVIRSLSGGQELRRLDQ